MKPFQAFAIVCLIPLSVLTVTTVAAAYGIPKGADRIQKIAAVTETAPVVAIVQDDADVQDADSDKADPMDEHMSVLQDGMRSMRRMLGKAEQKDAALELVGKLQVSAVACFDILPATTKEIEDPKAKAESRIRYQRRMVEVYDTLLQLELAFHQGDADKQKELYKALGKQKQSGHDAYQ